MMEEHAQKQREVQRLLGRCMLRVQQLEQIMRNILAVYDVGGALATFEADRAKRLKKLAKANFGDLVEELFGGYLVADVAAAGAAKVALPKRALRQHDAVTLPSDRLAFRTTVRLPMPHDEFMAAYKAMLKAVRLRNKLTHHFIRDFDIMSVTGCDVAAEYLISAYESISTQLLKMNELAKGLDEARRHVAAELQSKEFEDKLINGINEDGTVDWPRAGIVAAMREAARVGSVNGWMSMDDTITYIAQHHPEQTPQKYGCSDWAEVFEKSGLFDVKQFTVAEAEEQGLLRTYSGGTNTKGPN